MSRLYYFSTYLDCWIWIFELSKLWQFVKIARWFMYISWSGLLNDIMLALASSSCQWTGLFKTEYFLVITRLFLKCVRWLTLVLYVVIIFLNHLILSIPKWRDITGILLVLFGVVWMSRGPHSRCHVLIHAAVFTLGIMGNFYNHVIRVSYKRWRSFWIQTYLWLIYLMIMLL